jgi:error-prone DNA polymerase
MAAWRKSGMIETFHQKIVDGMLGNGYTREFAEQCFLQIRGFGEYGFPESHAASFALLVYVSAWLKRYHPAAFCAALLNSQPMGFYAPAQLVRDAREHGVDVRPADVNRSEWDCLLENATPSETAGDARLTADKHTWGHGGSAVRLGLRLIKGLHVAHAQRLVKVRNVDGPFASVGHFHRRTRLPRHTVQRLAEADAFSSLGLSRRQALWQALALDDQEAPLFERIETEAFPVQAPLPRMTLGREVRTDYATAGLSLKKHPVALVRAVLSQRNVITAAQLQNTPNGHWVRVAGLVLIRQRPGTASGIVFETLEDETGSMNLIVRPDVYDRYRVAARHAALAQADGWVERQGQVVHVMVKRMHDLSALLEAGFEIKSRDFH